MTHMNYKHKFLKGFNHNTNLVFCGKQGKHNVYKSRHGGWKICFTDWEIENEKKKLEDKWGAIEWKN